MNIIITGASKGIGRAVAEKFAANGYTLFLCARKEAPLAALAKELETQYPGSTVHYIPCDVSIQEEVLRFAAWVLSKTSAPGILVNNAGIFTPGNVYDEADGLLERMMETNLYSAYYLSRALLPAMMAQKSGHIFNICSIASLKAYPNGGSYSITKYALAGLTANLRHEMKPHGIKLTAVFPGAAYTGSWENSGISRDRFMEAADIAEMIYSASRLSPQACVEEIVMRPQLGDI
ncbi:MAG TPA: SDR family oxidoreductase [Flavitalea sp.]|nr:SDR family oxidoreductase [Flavitalea sp.]